MRRIRTIHLISWAALLLAAPYHGAEAAEPATEPPTAREGVDATVTNPPASSTLSSASPSALKAPGKCAEKKNSHEIVACMVADKKGNDCQMEINGATVDICPLKDVDLALAARVADAEAVKNEWPQIERHLNVPPTVDHVSLAPVAPTVLAALKSIWTDLAPELKEYAKRRINHERRVRIVAALEDGPCADETGRRLFSSTCAVVDVFASAHHGTVTSLAVLSRAARDDLDHLNAGILARKFIDLQTASAEQAVKKAEEDMKWGKKREAAKQRRDAEKQREAGIVIAVEALITKALLDSKNIPDVESLAAALGPSHEACGLRMIRYAREMTKKFGAGKPVPLSSVVWAGLTEMECNFSGEESSPSVIQRVINNSVKYPRGKIGSNKPFLSQYMDGAVEREREPNARPAGGISPTGETNPGVKEAPANLQEFGREMNASADLADVLSPDAGRWLRRFTDSFEVAMAISADDYKGAAAHAVRWMHDQGLAHQIRHIDIIVVLATEKDEAAMERTLGVAAVPAASWRVKSRKGALNITLSAMAGIQTAIEHRYGPYGTTQEAGAQHYQAPALQLPLGFDFSVGTGGNSFGLFVSTIDPLAFLQYDVNRQGRLPGPSVLTVLAPGLGVRIGLGRSPLSLMPFVAFRPRFRAWEPSVAGPGAHALQFGVALSFDIVLHSLLSRPGRSK